MKPVCGAIEAGGTKFVCLLGTGPDDIRAETRIPTTTPERTIGQAVEFLRAERDRHGPLAAVGIATFGPIDLHPQSRSYGSITSTPKPGWANTPIAATVRQALDVPVGFDTDVNAAALAEGRWGAAQGLHSFLYLTIGTGIGGGGVLDGRVMHGLLHPEMGHIRVPHDRARDPFAGSCPFHGDCLEGLASGPALAARWGRPGESLPAQHEAWALEAPYLAKSARCSTITCGCPRSSRTSTATLSARAWARARGCWARWRWRNRRKRGGAPFSRMRFD
jgi:fructokinase